MGWLEVADGVVRGRYRVVRGSSIGWLEVDFAPVENAEKQVLTRVLGGSPSAP
jgi:hypothetical protein